ncbi:MAG: hypothetical protein V4596_09760 [Bdellovibrionota bacterium]
MNIFEATTKVSKIAEQKYGCSVEFVYFGQNADHNDDSYNSVFETIQRNVGAQFVIAKGAILVPVYVDGEIFGSIVIKDGMNVDPLNFEDLHIFLDTTLKDFIIKKEKLRRIKIEESIIKANKMKESSSNVIPLFKNMNDDIVLSLTRSYEEKTTDIETKNDKVWRSALFLTGGDYTQTRAIAHDIHSLLNRNAFVPYSVLEMNSPRFSENLPSLGRISIYIPEILDLSQNEAAEIFNFIKNLSSREHPFFIISSQKSFDEIQKEALLDPELISALKLFHLEFQGKSNLKDFYSLLLLDPETQHQ